MIVSTRTAPSHVVHAEPPLPTLIGGARVDVCIVGGGLAGMIAAYYLAREKRSVMVLNEGAIGGMPAGMEVSQLASMVEQPYRDLERIHGAAAARIAAQGYTAAIDAIEAIVHRERIACEFERLDGYRFPRGDEARGNCEDEVDAARRAGVGDAELVPSAPIDGSPSGPCVRYPGQAQFHPLKFMLGLFRAITREGGRVHCGVRTRNVSAGRPCALVTWAGHRIQAQFIVTPARDDVASRTANVIGLRVPRGSVTRALYWESGRVLRCARLRSGNAAGELLLVAGEDEPEALAAWARGHFPRVGEIVQRFAGELPETPDLFTVLGDADGDGASLFLSTASWGSAMTRAVVAGMLIRDHVLSSSAACGEVEAASYCYA